MVRCNGWLGSAVRKTENGGDYFRWPAGPPAFETKRPLISGHVTASSRLPVSSTSIGPKTGFWPVPLLKVGVS